MRRATCFVRAHFTSRPGHEAQRVVSMLSPEYYASTMGDDNKVKSFFAPVRLSTCHFMPLRQSSCSVAGRSLASDHSLLRGPAICLQLWGGRKFLTASRIALTTCCASFVVVVRSCCTAHRGHHSCFEIVTSIIKKKKVNTVEDYTNDNDIID